MRTTIDKAGRVIVPKKLRDALWLEPGTEFEVFQLEDGSGLELKVVPAEFKLVRKGKHLVLEPSRPVRPITAEMVRQILEDVRDKRRY